MKKRIIFSWVDHRYDFTRTNGLTPSLSGLNAELHQYWYEQQGYDAHVLLSWKEYKGGGSAAAENLLQALQAFGHPIIHEEISFPDPLDLPAIVARLQPLLLQYGRKYAEMHVLFNTGYQMMQAAWLLLHQGLGNTTLIQVRKGDYTEDQRPRPEVIRLTPSPEAYAMLVHRNTPATDEAQAVQTASIAKIYERATVAAQTGYPIFITGESGTGKELLAQHIHRQSCRSSYHAVNCAAFSDELLRSELFGHTKGAFTGALSNKAGFFETADGGTLFLDEIGDTSPYIQQALLRATQNRGEFYRVGETEPRRSDVLLVVATNRQPQDLLAEGKFRQDLYFRLSVVRLHLPCWAELSPQERRDLIRGISEQVAQELGGHGVVPFDPAAEEWLLGQRMPGNLRQLSNFLRRIYIFHAHKKTFLLADVQAEWEDFSLGSTANSEVPSPYATMDEVEAWHYTRAYHYYQCHVGNTAKGLGKALNTVKTKLRDLGLMQ